MYFSRATLEGPYRTTHFLLAFKASGSISARIPYKPEVQVRPDRFIFQLTRMASRVRVIWRIGLAFIRIRKRHGFAFKRYDEGNIVSHILANPAEYLGAVYRVCSEWLARGKPRHNDLRAEGRMREWVQALDWIVQELFYLPALLEGHAETQDRISNPGLIWLREVCLVVEKEKRLREEVSATDLVHISRENSLFIPGLAKEATDDKAKLHLGRLLGANLR